MVTYAAGRRFTSTRSSRRGCRDDLRGVLAALSGGARRQADTGPALSPERRRAWRACRRGADPRLAVARRDAARRLRIRLAGPRRVREEPAGDVLAPVLVALQRFSYAVP